MMLDVVPIVEAVLIVLVGNAVVCDAIRTV